MPTKRQATADELRSLSEDLRSLLTTLTTDPAEQARKERRWKLLYGGLSAVSALVARRFATKTWSILTGERPPGKKKG
jgi:hypothetical protein